MAMCILLMMTPTGFFFFFTLPYYFRSDPSVNSITVTRNWKFDTYLSCEVAGRN